MLLSPRKNGLTSLLKEVRVFKVIACHVSRTRKSGQSVQTESTQQLSLISLQVAFNHMPFPTIFSARVARLLSGVPREVNAWSIMLGQAMSTPCTPGVPRNLAQSRNSPAKKKAPTNRELEIVGCPTSRHDHQRRWSRRAKVPLPTHDLSHKLSLNLTVCIDVLAVEHLACLSFWDTAHMSSSLCLRCCASVYWPCYSSQLCSPTFCYCHLLQTFPRTSLCSSLSSLLSLLEPQIPQTCKTRCQNMPAGFKTRSGILSPYMCWTKQHPCCSPRPGQQVIKHSLARFQNMRFREGGQVLGWKRNTMHGFQWLALYSQLVSPSNPEASASKGVEKEKTTKQDKGKQEHSIFYNGSRMMANAGIIGMDSCTVLFWDRIWGTKQNIWPGCNCCFCRLRFSKKG